LSAFVRKPTQADLIQLRILLVLVDVGVIGRGDKELTVNFFGAEGIYKNKAFFFLKPFPHLT
jgi:hypothetical protein